MGKQAKERREQKPDAVQEIAGKIVHSSSWEGGDGDKGTANLRITFTDGTSIKVCYSCMGGVFVSR